MKIRELITAWEKHAKGPLMPTRHHIHLDVESAARLEALAQMYPKRNVEQLVGELLGAALIELEASLPYVQGNRVVGTDELGNPLYEDIGPTPRFLSLARTHLHRLTTQPE
ncbi:pilin assembly protein [Pseudomonas borbori]